MDVLRLKVLVEGIKNSVTSQCLTASGAVAPVGRAAFGVCVAVGFGKMCMQEIEHG